MKPCPYRLRHEFNPKDGLCDHCFAPCEHRDFKVYNAVTLEAVCAGCGKTISFRDILLAHTPPLMPLQLITDPEV